MSSPLSSPCWPTCCSHFLSFLYLLPLPSPSFLPFHASVSEWAVRGEIALPVCCHFTVWLKNSDGRRRVCVGGGDDKRWNEELQKSKKGGEKGNQRENKGHVYRCLCLCERCENQPPEPHCALWRQGNIPLTAAWTLPHDDYPLAFGSFYSPTPSDLAEVCGKVNISSLSAMWRCKQLMGRIAVSFHGQLIQIKIRQLRPCGAKCWCTDATSEPLVLPTLTPLSKISPKPQQ